MRVLTETRDIGRDQWLEWRRKGIGGSDAASVVSLSPWRSPMRTWLDKTGQIEPTDDTDTMLVGRELEDMLAREFTRRKGISVRRRNAILQHDEHDWMLVNLDRMICSHGSRGPGVLECKVTTSWDGWDDGVPEHYVIQVQHALGVTGWQYGYVIVLLAAHGFKIEIFEIERDEEAIAALMESEAHFWNLVTTKTPPAMDGSDDCTSILKAMYPSNGDGAIDLTDDEIAIARDYLEAHEDEKNAKTRKQEAANNLRDILKDAGIGRYPDGTPGVTWKNNKPSLVFNRALFEDAEPEVFKDFLDPVPEFNLARLEAEKPDVYDKYLDEVPGTRTLRVKPLRSK